MVQTARLVATLAGMTVPNVVIMAAMGWTRPAHFALLGAWAMLATALIVLMPDRHRRPELRKRTAITALVGWVTLGAMILGVGWTVRPVIATLLILPGVNYLLLEAVGVTPKPRAASSPLP